MEEISPTELKNRLDAGDDLQIVDVREDNEVALGTIPNAKHIPLAQVLNRMNELEPDRETIVYCKMGGRSAKAVQFLRDAGFRKVRNLAGGIDRWAAEVEPKMPRY